MGKRFPYLDLEKRRSSNKQHNKLSHTTTGVPIQLTQFIHKLNIKVNGNILHINNNKSSLTNDHRPKTENSR